MKQKHKFSYVDLKDVEGGWNELFAEIPTWIAELRQSKFDPFKSKKEELEAIKDGKREEVLNRNLRFVVNLARRYISKNVNAWELVAAGTEGLSIAYQKFDTTKNVKLITYAVYLIRAKMLDVLQDLSAIKLSNRQAKLLAAYLEYGDLQLIKDKFPAFYPQTIETLQKNLENVLQIKFMSSLDDELYAGGEAKSTRLVADNASKDSGFIDAITDHLHLLTDDELLIISKVYGLGDENVTSSRKIAKELGINRTKIAKLKKSALAKLADQDELKRMFELITDDTSAVTWANSPNKV